MGESGDRLLHTRAQSASLSPWCKSNLQEVYQKMPLASLNHVQISIVSRRYCASEKQTKKNSSKNALEKCNKMGADTVDYRKFNSGSFNPD